MRLSRRTTAATTLLLALLALAAWSVVYCRQSVQVAEAAAQELAACQDLADKISRLRDRPAMAGVADMQLQDLARIIEEAAVNAKLDREQLVRIWPEAPRRLGDSPYLEKNTQVLVRDASLEQLVRFLVSLVSAKVERERTVDRELTVTSLRITAPRQNEGANRWTVEAVFSYLIYAPAPAPGSAPGSAPGNKPGQGQVQSIANMRILP